MAKSDRERPILFSSGMVSALLAGRKTQTRRVVKPQPEYLDIGGAFASWVFSKGLIYPNARAEVNALCPYGGVYDRLWVRETGWERPDRTAHEMREGADTWAPYYFDADGLTEQDHADFKKWGFKRRTSIHMPRWASRITLEITGVRIERLQDISDYDAKAEGVEPFGDGFKHYFFPDEPQAAWEFAKNSYASLRDKINGAGAWDRNPFVWVVGFKRA